MSNPKRLYRVTGSVMAGTYLGEFEAASAEEAAEMALRGSHISVCHVCADQISDPEVDPDSIVAELVED
jgi:hypothetical protein